MLSSGCVVYGTASGANFTDGDSDGDGDVDGFDFLAWQRGFSPAPLASVIAVNSNAVTSEDSLVLEDQFETDPAPLVAVATTVSEPATAIPLESQTAAITAGPLSAELVDAAIAMDNAQRSHSKSRLVSPGAPMEDNFDWVLDSLRWHQEPAWHGASKVDSHSVRNHANRGELNREADDNGVNEELLDELFAEGKLNSLLLQVASELPGHSRKYAVLLRALLHGY